MSTNALNGLYPLLARVYNAILLQRGASCFLAKIEANHSHHMVRVTGGPYVASTSPVVQARWQGSQKGGST